MELIFWVFSALLATFLSSRIAPKRNTKNFHLWIFLTSLSGAILITLFLELFGPASYTIAGNVETLLSSIAGAIILPLILRLKSRV